MKGRKRTNTEQKWIKGENSGISKKKNPTGGMDVCVVLDVWTVAWNVKLHEGRKDFNSTNGSKGKTQELIQKKNPAGGMEVCLS
jgi:hypothetical protein